MHQSSGDGQDLAHYIAHHWSGETKHLLHVANAAAKGDLKQALEAENFSVTFLPLYEARHAGALSDEAAAAIRSGVRTVCLIHSAKAADAFLSLAKGLDLSKTVFVAISPQAAIRLKQISTGGVHAAEHPDEAHLMKCLARVIAGG